MSKIEKSEEEWRRELDPESFKVCREQGTEAAFSGKYWDLKDEGEYKCAACGQPLFSSATKFDSGSGWPSFYQPESDSAVEERQDNSHGMKRTEVVCTNCASHLGHVFPDGPRETTGLRYCINSAALDFEATNKQKSK